MKLNPNKSISPAVRSKLESALDKVVDEYTVPRQEGNASSSPVHAIIAGVSSGKETLYLKAKGIANVTNGEVVSVDHVMSFFSCSKALTSTAVLQLHEQGKLDIDGDAAKYYPKIGTIGLIDEGSVSDEDGSFTIPPRPPKEQITIKHLLTHTSGIAYAFTSIDYFNLMTKRGGDLKASQIAPLDRFPLIFEPGSSFMYGHSTDWLGLIVQEVTGQSLHNYLTEHVFKPIGMNACTFHLRDPKTPFMELHRRTSKAGIVVHRSYAVEKDPSIDMGGQGCFGTVGDYLKFLRIWLNDGVSPDTGARILQADTVRYAVMNHLPEDFAINFDTAISSLHHENAKPDGFTIAGCAYANSALPTGRPETLLYWSGLANLYFWVDIKNKLAGFWATQLFPYMDPVSIEAYLKFEKTVYDVVNENEARL